MLITTRKKLPHQKYTLWRGSFFRVIFPKHFFSIMSEKYKIRDQDKLYFVTFSVMNWIDVFTRWTYNQILIESLKHCQLNKGLEVYAWCIMTNHVHLIVGRNGNQKIEDILRDFKKFTSVAVVRSIAQNPEESRKVWLLRAFKNSAENSSKHQKYRFWQSNYHPVELSDNFLMQQKLDYLHDNPVKAGIVREAHDYNFSSAIDYSGGKGLLDIKFIE